MKIFLLLLFCFAVTETNSQSIGLGTSTPNSASVLDMGPSAKPVVLPRLSSAEMNAVSPAAGGMLVYNTDEHQLYSYMRYRTSSIVFLSNYRWQPVSTGPRMLAWGIIDSFGVIKSGSGSFSMSWDATNNWYRLSFTSPHEYYKDSMILSITPVGNGSWDQTVSTGEIIEGNSRIATIKFTDVSRMVAGWLIINSRRRSWFHFVVYDLRKSPY